MKIINNVVNNKDGFKIEYLSADFDPIFRLLFNTSAFLGKIRKDNAYLVASYGFISEVLDTQSDSELLGVAIIPDAKLLIDGSTLTVREFLIAEIGEETYNFLPRITEEEFYSIPE
jgi:hypothetical protein